MVSLLVPFNALRGKAVLVFQHILSFEAHVLLIHFINGSLPQCGPGWDKSVPLLCQMRTRHTTRTTPLLTQQNRFTLMEDERPRAIACALIVERWYI